MFRFCNLIFVSWADGLTISNDMNVNKGDVLSVCVEDVSDGVLIVTFNAQDTNYKGVLLKDQW